MKIRKSFLRINISCAVNINEFINFIDKIAVYLAINLTGYNSEILLKSLANFSSLLANH